MTVYVINMRDPAPEGIHTINVTSRDRKEFSPFFLGPCELYDGNEAMNVENAWQFAKVYPRYVDHEGMPSEAYFRWARKGWKDTRAHRYPMGKNARPLYSWWDGEKLGYVEARKRIYVPLYCRAVERRVEFAELKEQVEAGHDVALRDFDGYRNDLLDMSLADVLNCSTRKMGHAFALAMVLTGDPALDETDYSSREP